MEGLGDASLCTGGGSVFPSVLYCFVSPFVLRLVLGEIGFGKAGAGAVDDPAATAITAALDEEDVLVVEVVVVVPTVETIVVI